MSKFEAKVYKLKIKPHPNADTLELCEIGDYMSAVRKGEFKTGDLGVYIDENSLIPEWLLKKVGLWDDVKNKGKLDGPEGNRIKSKRLRKVLSTGLIYPVGHSGFSKGLENCIEYYGSNGVGSTRNEPNTNAEWHNYVVHEGDDVTKILGITKYEPTVPTHMNGEIWNASGLTLNFDIENLKKYRYLLRDGEDVAMLEKAHGTFVTFGYSDGKYIIHSKGLGSQGLAFRLNKHHKTIFQKTKHKVLSYINSIIDIKYSDEINQNNLYVKIFREHILPIFTKHEFTKNGETPQSVYLLGEIFGPVQDLTYGQKAPAFRLFDVYIGLPNKGRYLNFDEKLEFARQLRIPMVPILYRGSYSKEKVLEFTSGKETISGKELHMREGIVITPTVERRCDEIGRVILKSVSDEYLDSRNKKHATEYT